MSPPNKHAKIVSPIPKPHNCLDDIILDNESSGSEIDIEVVPEAEEELPLPLGGEAGLLLCVLLIGLSS